MSVCKRYQNLKAANFINDTVRIGQATSGENGKLKGGKAGDQSGGEVSMSNWSYSSGDNYNTWDIVFRAKDSAARLRIAQAAIDACNNNHIGYDQNSPDRKTCFKQAQKVDFDLSAIKTDCELTCSELANVCIAAAGLKSYLSTDKMAYVDSLKSKLKSSSEFVSYTSSAFTNKNSKLIPGDIIMSGGHTALVVKTPKRSGTKTIATVAEEVIDGQWGSGDARKIALEAFGYDYNVVQQKVNEIINGDSMTIDKVMSACYDQAVCMKNSQYKWESSPTVEKSKKKGTCVTYVACVLQRLGYLKSGQHIWHNGKGYGTGKVTGSTTSKMTVTYMNNKTFKALKSTLKAGDIVLVDDNKSGESGNGGHIMIFKGFSGDTPYVWDNNSGQNKNYQFKAHSYGSSRKILAIIRLKDLAPVPKKSIDELAQEVINGKWGSGEARKKNLEEAGYDYEAVQKRVNEILSKKKTYSGKLPSGSPVLKKGSKGNDVILWQKYLNWYSNGEFFNQCGAADGTFGTNTHKWSCKFQEKEIGKGQGDGLVGPKTIAAAKKVKR